MTYGKQLGSQVMRSGNQWEKLNSGDWWTGETWQGLTQEDASSGKEVSFQTEELAKTQSTNFKICIGIMYNKLKNMGFVL